MSRDELLRSRLDRFTRMLHGVDAGAIRAVHRARVASRRLRELLPLLQLDAGVTEKLSHRLRRATRRLGTVRELDVLIELTEELHQSGGYPDRALRQVATEVRQARAEAFGKLLGKRAGTELRRIARKLEKVERQIRGAGHRETTGRAWRWAMDARVARRAATAKRAIEDAGSLYLPERLHVARIAVKKLRYGMELVADAVGGARGGDLRTLKREQTLLGRMHDLQVLIGRARRVQARLVPSDAIVSRDLDSLVVALDADCRRLHARYVRDRAKLLDICRRLAASTPAAARAHVIRRVG